MSDQAIAEQTASVAVKPWNFSATAGEKWIACPQAFAFKYEEGVPELSSPTLNTGRLMAMTLERYLRHCVEKGLATDVTEIEPLARRVFAEEGVGLGLDALDEVLRICGQYVRGHMLDLERLAGVEVWLPPEYGHNLTLAGRRVVGKVDELYFSDDGTKATVRDAKTNRWIWPDWLVREKLQARIYPVLVLYAFPEVEEVEVVFDFVRWNVERRVIWSRVEIEEERQKLAALVKQMQTTKDRPATPGGECSWCSYTSRCPAFKAARESGFFIVPTTVEEALKVGETMAVLESGLRQRREALQGFAKEHGPVVVRDIQFGYFEAETPVVDPHAFCVWCRENDLDPLDFLRVPTPELRRLLRKGKDREGLAQIVRNEIETRWGSRKRDEEEATA